MATDNESWGWVIFWLVATPIVSGVFPILGLFSLGLALYYGGKRLLK